MPATVLLTGVTGYIGSRLLRALERDGRQVRCLARRPEQVATSRSTTEVVKGDCLDEASLAEALAGIDTAYYLVHSMGAGSDFAELDRRAATNFGRAAARTGVRRIVYLGGLADDRRSLSTHLKSRADTGDALRAGGVPILEFRAGIVIGAGSLSFEMIRALVERLPVMICPRWVDTLTQPIAIDDVVRYLVAGLDLPTGPNVVFEIGGPDVITYGDLMRRYARLRGLHRLLIPVPVLTPHLSGLWLALVTPAHARIGRALVDGLRNTTIVRSPAAREAFPFELTPLDAAIRAAVDEGTQAHWKFDTRTVDVDVRPAQAFAPIRRIGGSAGWYYGSLLWQMRGLVDRGFGGPGMRRGRRDPEHCVEGDVIDGWTVEACEPDRRLRLSADLKLPGRGWLEFEVTPLDDGRRARIRQTAMFDPRGLGGRLYWYAILPFHALIFGGLLRRLAELAEQEAGIADRSVFVHRSVIPASASDVFGWHERPDALAQLLPAGRLMRVERQSGGIRDGGRVELSVGIGPARVRLEARHFGYVAGQQFCDQLVRGPFSSWRHTHRVEAISARQSVYEDRIEYTLPGGRFVARLLHPIVGRLLAREFGRRHEIVRRQVGVPARPRSTARIGATAVLLAALIAAAPAGAQDTVGVGTIRGRLADPNGRAVADAAVCVPATSQCTVSDAEGAFVLLVRAGTYALEVVPPGAPLVVSDEIQVRAGLESVIEVALPAADGLSQTVTVTAPVFAAPEDVKTSSFLVAPRAIGGSAGALQDVSRYVQSLPGVVAGTNDFRNDLLVRGGSPLDNLFIVDNIEIPNINSFATFASAGGTVSLLDVQLIDNVTFLTGGYPAPYGNKTSSVLQVTLREGRRDRLAGRATVGFAGAGGVLEGPIGRGGKGSWVLSARRSFLDLFTDDTGIGGVPVLYTVSGKAVYDLSPRDRLWLVNVSGLDTIRLGLTDSIDLSEELSTLDITYDGWRSATGVNWQRAAGRAVSLFGVTYSRARVDQQVKDLLLNGVPPPGTPVADQIASGPVVFREASSETDTTIKYDLTSSFRFVKRLQAGGAVKYSQVDYDSASPFGNDSPFFPTAGGNAFAVRERFSAVQASAYVQATRPIARHLTLTGGVRLDRYPLAEVVRVSPRLGLDRAATPRLTLRASFGQYYQQPPFLFLVAFPENRTLKPFRADHYVGGFTFDIDSDTRVSVEGYRKQYRDYPVSREIPALSLASVGDTFAVRDVLFPLVNDGRGSASGIEAFVERRASRDGRWRGQANLAVSRARYAGVDGVLRPGSFDYPVVANIDGAYRLSPAWTISARMAYLGGRPITPIDDALATAQRRAVYDLSRVNADRTPDYFRLDLRVDRAFRRGDRTITVFAGVQNVTNRKNVAQYSWDRRNNAPRVSEQLGLFPILGLEWPF